ncbi:MAG: glycosyltransferase [Gammaproteobacteria bacterium]|nr:glycosyltransferase [Gammaproteobacteria bacterium]
MDCLVAPSRIEETFGRVVVEAQACAIPVIAMASAGMVEAFRPGVTGLSLHSPDPVAVEDAIIAMASDPAMHATMASNAVAFASQFDMTEIAETFIKILEMS